MFLGKFKIYFSGKNRLILPKKVRKGLGNDEMFYVIMGQDGEVWGFDTANWLIQTENILNKPLSSREGREERRNFFSRAEECLLDRQGRFILPQEFVDGASLKEEVLVIGAGDHFEIWDSQKWEMVDGGVK